jgi:hypothetical protein
MHIRKVQLKFGVSRAEWAYFARRKYIAMTVDRSSIEQAKEEDESALVRLICAHWRVCELEMVKKVLKRCGVDYSKEASTHQVLCLLCTSVTALSLLSSRRDSIS